MRAAFRLAWSRTSERTMRLLLDLVSRVPPLAFEWERLKGPYFGDQIATLTLDGSRADLVLEQARIGADGQPALGGRRTGLRLS